MNFLVIWEAIMSIGERLKKLRKDENISQENLSMYLGIHRSSISLYERDIRNAPIDVLEKYCKYFGVSIDYITGFYLDENSYIYRRFRKIPVYSNFEILSSIDYERNVIGWMELNSAYNYQGEYVALKVNCNTDTLASRYHDLFIVKKQSYISDGDIALIKSVNDGDDLKIVEKSEKGLSIIPIDSSIFPHEFVCDNKIDLLDIIVIGKVVDRIRKF